SLRDRVGTYFAPRNVDPKVQALTAQIEGVEVTVTNSETEALLLEYNLIKAHKPRFNVVLRDDKSFPYIHLYVEHEFPRLQFERAAQIRDQRAALQRIQAQQIVTAEGQPDVDVFAIVGEAGEYAVSVMLVRGGRNLGTTSYFPRAALAEADEALASFILQYYADAEAPAEVLLGSNLEEAASLSELLSERTGQRTEVRHPVRGLAARWVELTRENAVQALRMRLAQRAGLDEMFSDL